MVAEMLAAGLNANCGGRNHVGVELERQIAAAIAEKFGFPPPPRGCSSPARRMANFLGVLIARRAALGAGVRDAA